MTKRSGGDRGEEATMPSWKKLVLISAIVALAITFAFGFYFIFRQTPEVTFPLNAAIIDQLAESDPSLANSTFVESATSILKSRNFTVTYHNKTLGVDFFKGLAKYNYGVIILRTHSALREDNSTVDLFTSEEFKEFMYRSEQERGLLVRGEFLYRPGKYYFAATSKFIESLEGRFSKSIVIAMGCWSLKPNVEKMAQAFIDKGAKAYVGWTDLVFPQETDNETLKLLMALLVKNRTLSDALLEARNYTYTDEHRSVTTRLRFYPSSVGNLRITDLIHEARISTILKSSTVNYLELSPLICFTSVISYKSKNLDSTERTVNLTSGQED